MTNINSGEEETRGESAQAGVYLLRMLRHGGQPVRAGGAQVQVSQHADLRPMRLHDPHLAGGLRRPPHQCALHQEPSNHQQRKTVPRRLQVWILMNTLFHKQKMIQQTTEFSHAEI